MAYKDPNKKREYGARWVASRRAAYFSDKVCSYCQGVDSLELDHIDPATKITNSIWSWSTPRRESEISKCQVLCHECHLEKTKLWWDGMRKHGDQSTYRRGCRCELCKSKELSRWRAQRKKRRNRAQ